MPEFHVKRTFAVEGGHFVLAGSVAEGEIGSGMSVRVPFNLTIAMTARIDRIEFTQGLSADEDACLYIRYTGPEELEIWRALDIGDEIIEITTDGSD